MMIRAHAARILSATLHRNALLVLAAAIVIAAVVLATLPRYSLHVINTQLTYRLDRWTGNVDVMRFRRGSNGESYVDIQRVTATTEFLAVLEAVGQRR